ncbi:MAG TPA: ROK family transcriptional regulator [Jatrophihabitans sp.]|jgi:predicted NBD/HSP70 family sugar kinase|nr:ROK family transcriptional regulator [Jatrophihabitans sp.]
MTGPGSPSAWRSANRERVLAVLRQRGALPQAEIVRATGLASATVSNIVAELRDEGLLERRDGSPRAPLYFSQRAGLVVGMDLDHRRLRVLLADQSHTVLGERVQELDVDHQAAEAVQRAGEMTDELLAKLGAERSDVVAVGMGLSGPIDPRTGEVASSTILPGWVGVRAGDMMGDALGLPVQVDNSANLAALGEAVWGAARGCRHVAYVQVGTGIGAGLLLEGRVYRGVYGTVGEIGHIVTDPGGALCRCGSRGCLETVAGLESLVQAARRQHGPDLDEDDLLTLVAAGDIGARRLVSDAGAAVGAAVAGLCNLLCPERVVIGGQLAAAGQVLLDPLRRSVERDAIERVALAVQVVGSELAGRAETMGAVALALDADPLDAQSAIPRS